MTLPLTLEQKAALLSGQDFWSTHPVEEMGVPSVVMTDGPHGIRRQAGSFDHIGLNASLPATCFPPAVAVGCSWDREVARRVGGAVGAEARALGVHIALGPGINIKRSPLCGRNFEYYSEDPLLAGELAAAHVSGQQEVGVGASLKHFAANNQETDRMQVSADIDERTLREIYLTAFERVVTTARPATVMCSYNRINGVYSSENRWLLTDLLRGEWGFSGLVVSDWGAVHDPVAAVAAGLDLEMPGTGGASAQMIVDAVRAGRLDEAEVDAAAERVLALAGLVQEPSPGFDVEGHHQLARDLAADCAVLLKNDHDVLPISGVGVIAVIGELADHLRFQGGGSSHINATRVDTPIDAIRAAAAGRGIEVRHHGGYEIDRVRSAATGAGVAVVFAGLRDREESEGFDRTSLSIADEQIAAIRDAADAAGRTVVVLANGSVVSLEGWHDDADAILEGFLLGQAGGGAIADLLFGDANPSGRLAETIPLRLEDTPAFVNFPGEAGHVRYGEGVMVGYRWYETVGREVRYPFGYGLSYTTFATSALTVEVIGDDTARARVTVTNTGRRAGKHVVQLYVATSCGPVRRPQRELRAFTKVALEPGQSEEVTFELDRRAFAYYDLPHREWVVGPGDYTIQIADDASTVRAETTIRLAGQIVIPILTIHSSLGEWLGHPTAGPLLSKAVGSFLGDDTESEMFRMAAQIPIATLLNMFAGALPTDLVDEIRRVAQ
ncbi:MAG TPA: glycoside hydrolase family 3 C-terminal domain-containing protein [Acidimicrobiales bacterium]|jgi:beta-glucosidase|nr:glycoside hydrolase family 3 C-terminal domain-containing protein [Acidimicrobiales bacterium]